MRTLADASSIGIESTDVALSSPGVGTRMSRHRPGTRCSARRLEHPRLLGRVVHRAGLAEEDDRAVVHRMVEGGPGQDQAVEQRDRDADLHPAGHGLEHPAGRRSVDIEPIAHPHVDRRDHERPPVGDEAHMADQPLVEDGVDQRAVVGAASREAADCRPVGARDLVHRGRPFSLWGLGIEISRRNPPSYRGRAAGADSRFQMPESRSGSRGTIRSDGRMPTRG